MAALHDCQRCFNRAARSDSAFALLFGHPAIPIVAAAIVSGVNNAGGLHLAKALLRHGEPGGARL